MKHKHLIIRQLLFVRILYRIQVIYTLVQRHYKATAGVATLNNSHYVNVPFDLMRFLLSLILGYAVLL